MNFRECRDGYLEGFEGSRGKRQTGLKDNLKNKQKEKMEAKCTKCLLIFLEQESDLSPMCPGTESNLDAFETVA